MDNELLDGFFLRDIRIEPLTGTVHGPDGPRHLSPRSVEVLLCLAKSPRRLVTREYVLNKVWGSPDASSEALSHVIGDIRHGLGDKVDDPTFIQTVPRRGYRLLVEPRPLVEQPPRRDTDTSAPPVWQALVRHGVVQALVAYIALGWLAIQFADTTFLNLNLPAWTVPFVTFVVVGGLPVVILLSWFLEMTEGRIVDDKGQHTGGLLAGLGRNYLAIVAAYVVATAGAGVYQVLVGFEGPATVTPVAQVPAEIDEVMPVQPNSLAVLRFENLDGSSRTEVFGAGLSEDILDRVARVPGILVASRTDTWSLSKPVTSDKIRRQLRVAYFLEGTVRIVNDEVTVVAQFINSATGFHLFSKEITSDLSGLNEIQKEVTGLIVAELKVSLPEEIQSLNTVPEGEDGVDAYMYFRMGRAIMYEPQSASNLQQAREYFEQALELDPNYGAAFAGLCAVALDAYEISGSPGDLDDAEQACGRSAMAAPQLPVVHRTIGRLNRLAGRLDTAIAAYSAALEINPQDAEAMLGLAEVYTRQDRTELAIEAAEKAIDLQPGNWQAYNTLGNIHFTRGRYSEAVGFYKKVRFLDPDNFVVMGNLATAQMMSGDFEDARDNFEKMLEIDSHPFLVSNIGILHYYLGDFDKAVEVHRSNVESAPDLESSWVNLADALYFAGEEDQAVAAFQRAADLAEQRLNEDPANAETLTYLAWAITMLGDTSRGAELADRAIELAPDDPYSYYYRALVAHRSGDDNRARRSIRKALDLGYSEVMLSAEPYLVDLEP